MLNTVIPLIKANPLIQKSPCLIQIFFYFKYKHFSNITVSYTDITSNINIVLDLMHAQPNVPRVIQASQRITTYVFITVEVIMTMETGHPVEHDGKETRVHVMC